MDKKTILVVDDEKNFCDFIKSNLLARQFSVHTASTGLEALAIFQTEQLDLIILDIMLPNMDGFEVCRRIRAESTVPILALTALGEQDDKVRALELGVDDYLTKPFGVEELLARIRSILRRVQWEQERHPATILRHRDLMLDPNRILVEIGGKKLEVTRTEFNLLYYFMQNQGKVLSHRDILQNVWGEEYGNEAEYLRVYIGRLRRKIELEPDKPQYLTTEYGYGYRFG
ncbi:MAG: response regulator transcription factor [Chloroflexi bacterium]|nr:response regulator transcription factor [Chloroflexota bacterium]